MRITSSNNLNDVLWRINRNMVLVEESDYSKRDKELLLSIYKKLKRKYLRLKNK